MVESIMYEPAEDSYLLSKQSRKYSFGDVLDLGCGTGIQGLSALEGKIKSITFADINHEALMAAKLNFEKMRSSKQPSVHGYFIQSDLFENIPKKYDTIIFNPPYLPDDDLDNAKLVTTGGKYGYELTIRFLESAYEHLKDNGIILLLFSSLTGKKKIDSAAKSLYNIKQLAKENHFMEQLYVYKLSPLNIMKGHRGIVVVAKKKVKGKIVYIATKRSRTSGNKSFYDGVSEARYLKKLNGSGIGPKFYSYDAKTESLSMQYIDGKRINEYIADPKISKNRIFMTIKDIVAQLIIMDKLLINKFEMTNPYKHIIIESKSQKPVMIDFERCHETLRPKNITQFIQYLCSANMVRLLGKKHIRINKDRLMDIAKHYRQTDDSNALQIMNCLL